MLITCEHLCLAALIWWGWRLVKGTRRHGSKCFSTLVPQPDISCWTDSIYTSLYNIRHWVYFKSSTFIRMKLQGDTSGAALLKVFTFFYWKHFFHQSSYFKKSLINVELTVINSAIVQSSWTTNFMVIPFLKIFGFKRWRHYLHQKLEINEDCQETFNSLYEMSDINKSLSP